MSNYRPVPLTSIPCKMLERITRSSLVEDIEVNNLFSKHKHGFTKNTSCLTNLLETIEEWTEAIENGYGLDVFFLDYQKVFDTVQTTDSRENCIGMEYTLHYYLGYVNILARDQ